VNEEKMGEVSDGYHTFDELYEHRHSLFLALMRCLPYCSWLSRWHDDGTFSEGVFICGIDLPCAGGTVTYHLPERLWATAVATGAKKLERAPKWDGHTSDDVVSRLIHFATF
jgi:hypothetical protein